MVVPVTWKAFIYSNGETDNYWLVTRWINFFDEKLPHWRNSFHFRGENKMWCLINYFYACIYQTDEILVHNRMHYFSRKEENLRVAFSFMVMNRTELQQCFSPSLKFYILSSRVDALSCWNDDYSPRLSFVKFFKDVHYPPFYLPRSIKLGRNSTYVTFHPLNPLIYFGLQFCTCQVWKAKIYFFLSWFFYWSGRELLACQNQAQE